MDFDDTHIRNDNDAILQSSWEVMRCTLLKKEHHAWSQSTYNSMKHNLYFGDIHNRVLINLVFSQAYKLSPLMDTFVMLNLMSPSQSRYRRSEFCTGFWLINNDYRSIPLVNNPALHLQVLSFHCASHTTNVIKTDHLLNIPLSHTQYS